MHRIFGLVIVVGLIGGLLGAVAVSELSSSAGAAPTPQQVREQNLDGSGFIRVHEQGTVSVAGTVNVGNLPAVQDVNVVSQPAAPQGSLIDLTPMTLISAEVNADLYQSPLVDIGDCELITMLVRGGIVSNTGNISPDGTIQVRANFTGEGGTHQTHTVDSVPISSSITNAPVAAPFAQIEVDTAHGTPPPTAWIWCEP